MTKVALIGNSHLAAYRVAIDQMPGKLNFDVTFFGSPAGSLAALRAEPGRLFSSSPHLTRLLNHLWGVDELDVSGFDYICLVGMGAGVRLVSNLYADYRSENFKWERGKYLVSDSTFRAAVSGLLDESLFGNVVRSVRQATGAPILSLPQPLPCETIMKPVPPGWLIRAIENGDAEKLMTLTETVKAQQFGLRAVLPQPPETLASPLTTKVAFMRNSVRLSADMERQHEEDDTTHANADYGAVVLDALDRFLISDG